MYKMTFQWVQHARYLKARVVSIVCTMYNTVEFFSCPFFTLLRTWSLCSLPLHCLSYLHTAGIVTRLIILMRLQLVWIKDWNDLCEPSLHTSSTIWITFQSHMLVVLLAPVTSEGILFISVCTIINTSDRDLAILLESHMMCVYVCMLISAPGIFSVKWILKWKIYTCVDKYNSFRERPTSDIGHYCL